MQTLYTDMAESIQGVIVNYMKLWTARWLCYGQCWSKTAETNAMWRIHSYDKKAIRIETDAANYQAGMEPEFYLDRVAYMVTLKNLNYKTVLNEAENEAKSEAENIVLTEL